MSMEQKLKQSPASVEAIASLAGERQTTDQKLEHSPASAQLQQQGLEHSSASLQASEQKLEQSPASVQAQQKLEEPQSSIQAQVAALAEHRHSKEIDHPTTNLSAEAKVFHPQHRFSIKKAFEAAKNEKNAAAGKHASISSARSQQQSECKCLPILERDVSISDFGGSRSTSAGTAGKIQIPAYDTAIAAPPDGRDSSENLGPEVTFNGRKMVKDDYKFDAAENRHSGGSYPSPKTDPNKAKAEAPSPGTTTPVQSNTELPEVGASIPSQKEVRDPDAITSAPNRGNAAALSPAPASGSRPDITASGTTTTPADRALLELFAPLYNKRAKIVTYNERAQNIKRNQDMPPATVKIDPCKAKFRPSLSSASLKELVSGERSSPKIAEPKSKGSAKDLLSNDDVETRAIVLSPRRPSKLARDVDGNDEAETKVNGNDGQPALSERRLSEQIAKDLKGNDDLRKELLIPIVLPESTFACEYSLMIDRWTHDNRQSPKQAEKQWRKHVRDNAQEAVETLENAIDTMTFKRRRRGIGSAEDEIMVQMARDEVSCAKGRQTWYEKYRKETRREKRNALLGKIGNVLTCRVGKEKEGPLVKVLRKMSDENVGSENKNQPSPGRVAEEARAENAASA